MALAAGDAGIGQLGEMRGDSAIGDMRGSSGRGGTFSLILPRRNVLARTSQVEPGRFRDSDLEDA